MLSRAGIALALIAVSLRAEEARAQPYLVKDIKPGGDSNPLGLVALGGSLLFFADDGVVGTELWKTDGTAAGTALVKDIVPGAAGSVTVAAPVVLGGNIYFFSGATFWKSDGTSAGTSQVAAVAGTTATVTAGGNMFFGGVSISAGYELWKSDGTSGGTAMVKDIYPGAPGSIGLGTNIVPIGASVVFIADDGTHGAEPWVSDGTLGGTMILQDVKPGSSSSNIPTLVGAGSIVYFTADDGTHGQELWKTDGTPGGTVMVTDLQPGSTSSYPRAVGATAGKMLFTASAAQAGLYATDGTALGTTFLTNAVFPYAGVDIGGVFVFVGNDVAHGYELWKSDATAVGTVLVKDIHPGAASSVVPGSYPICTMRAVGTTVYFCADDGTTGGEPWKTDGTAAGTVPLEISLRGNSEPGEIVPIGSAVYIAATNGVVGRELWVSGGGVANDAGVPPAIGPSPYLVKDVKPGVLDSSPFGFVDLGGTLVFFADDGASGVEPWKSDGTTLGTSMLKDVHIGSADSYQANAGRPAVLGGSAYFPATTGSDTGLWKTDGTSAGTVEVKSGLYATSLTPTGASLFMWAWSASPFTYQLWKSDGTTAGTVLVKDVQPGTSFGLVLDGSIVSAGGKAFFAGHDATNGSELWTSDGTTGGTAIVKDIATGTADATPSLLTAVGAKVFFVANDATTDAELWVSDGTDGGTVRLTSSTPSYAEPASLTALGTSLYFVGQPDGFTYGLWKSDGTVMGTTLVKAVNALDLVAANGTLFFFGFDAATGYELWKSDGTTGGTALVKDIRPGIASSYPVSTYGACPPPRAVGNLLVFCAEDGTRGYELWQSDGTEAGTVPMEISPHGNATPGEVVQSGARLFFAASDGPTGVELFALGGSGPGPGPGGDGGASSSSGGSSSGSSGASGGSSSGASGGDAPGAGGGGDSSSGCGCVVAGDSTWWGAPALFALGLAALVRRLRR
ncbi:MAG TPA: ELWxxDGT repeat protein [Labilithrix sp.]